MSVSALYTLAGLWLLAIVILFIVDKHWIRGVVARNDWWDIILLLRECAGLMGWATELCQSACATMFCRAIERQKHVHYFASLTNSLNKKRSKRFCATTKQTRFVGFQFPVFRRFSCLPKVYSVKRNFIISCDVYRKL